MTTGPTIRSLSNNDGDGNDNCNVKKTSRFGLAKQH